MTDKQLEETQEVKVGWQGYVAFFLALIFFSGIFATATDWTRVLDFSVMNGSFGQIQGAAKNFTFRGINGSGARDGFMFALELLPAVIFALGVVSVVDGYGGLKVAQKLMTPLLKPLLGLPGICALSCIANMQSTDAGAGMVKELYDASHVTDDERSVAITYQISASAFISNYFSSGVALFGIIMVPIIVPVLVMILFKIIGANMMRLYLKYEHKKSIAGGAK